MFRPRPSSRATCSAASGSVWRSTPGENTEPDMELPPALRQAVDKALEGVSLADLRRAADLLSRRYRGEVRDGRLICRTAPGRTSRTCCGTSPRSGAWSSDGGSGASTSRPRTWPRSVATVWTSSSGSSSGSSAERSWRPRATACGRSTTTTSNAIAAARPRSGRSTTANPSPGRSSSGSPSAWTAASSCTRGGSARSTTPTRATATSPTSGAPTGPRGCAPTSAMASRTTSTPNRPRPRPASTATRG